MGFSKENRNAYVSHCATLSFVPASSMLRNVKAPLDNFARCAGIVLEIPPMGQMGYEFEIEGLWKKLCGCHQTVCMIVQPDSHRRHARVCWVRRWRNLPTAQKHSFKQCCSCQFGKTDAHIKYYVCRNLGGRCTPLFSYSKCVTSP